jgi:hypothetical protein
MRKPILSTLLALLGAATLSAQMMPDSTVAITARWEVGDKMDYTCITRTLQMDADGNETPLMSSKEALRFVVAEATDSTYTLNIHVEALEGEQKSAELQMLTNRHGTFLGGEAILAPMLFFHGAQVDTTGSYTFQQPFSGIIGTGTVTLDTHFEVDSALTDEYSVVMRMETEADETQLRLLLRDYMFSRLLAAGEATDEDYDDFLDQFDEEIHANPIKAFFGEYVTEEVELSTGWPLQWIYDRYVEISQGEIYSGIHLVREISPEDKIGGE